MAAQRCGIDAVGAVTIRRAGFLHDLGRVAVHPRIWQKPGPLTADEWEQVRLHPYHTERVLSRSPFFSALCPIADAHHERLDGSGYHRGVNGSALGLSARLLAAADAYHATPSRGRIDTPFPKRLRAPRRGGDAGRPDAHAVTAVLEQAGQQTAHEHPAGSPSVRSSRRLAGAGVADEAGCTGARNLDQDGRPAHPERLSQDHGFLPCCGNRDAMEHDCRMGELLIFMGVKPP
jgi:hypothetical protein